MKPMPEKEYIDISDSGLRYCPLCSKGDLIEGEGVCISDFTKTDFTCRDCGATWREMTKVIGYDNLEDKDGNEICITIK